MNIDNTQKYIRSIKNIPIPNEEQIKCFIDYISKIQILQNYFDTDSGPRERIIIFPSANAMMGLDFDKAKEKFVPVPVEKELFPSHDKYVLLFGNLSYSMTIHNVIPSSWGSKYYLLKEYNAKIVEGVQEVYLPKEDRFSLPFFITKNGVRLSRKFFQPGNEEYKKKKKEELFQHVKKILETIEELKKKMKQ